ncbi:MAG: hypothetical protein NT172_16660 [Planctomycetota bacterium]|nr:hypothetical protein [Planctomycetota bacterium]
MQILNRLVSAVSARSGRPKRSVKRRSYGLEPLENREVLTVTFYGGNVLPAVEAQAVYLGSG